MSSGYTVVRSRLQDRPVKFIDENPQQKWRCDIFAHDGSDHHGIGRNESEAMLNAVLAYRRYQVGEPQ